MYKFLKISMGIWTFICLIGLIATLSTTINGEFVEATTKLLSGGYFYVADTTKNVINTTAAITLLAFWLDVWFKPVLIMGILAILSKPKWVVSGMEGITNAINAEKAGAGKIERINTEKVEQRKPYYTNPIFLVIALPVLIYFAQVILYMVVHLFK